MSCLGVWVGWLWIHLDTRSSMDFQLIDCVEAGWMKKEWRLLSVCRENEVLRVTRNLRLAPLEAG